VLAVPGAARSDSKYRRIQRFLSEPFGINFDVVARFVMTLFGFLDVKVYLTLDRTNWQWGQSHINILMLGVAYKGIAIPIYWILLNKKGNSNTRERIALVKRFVDRFGKDRIIKLLADREFIGCDWFKWLEHQGIGFAVRIKKNTLVSNSRGEKVQVRHLFRGLKTGETQILLGKRRIYEGDAYLSALRLKDGGLLIVATGDACMDAIESYAKRWEIETLLGCLKGRGLCLKRRTSPIADESSGY